MTLFRVSTSAERWMEDQTTGATTLARRRETRRRFPARRPRSVQAARSGGRERSSQRGSPAQHGSSRKTTLAVFRRCDEENSGPV